MIEVFCTIIIKCIIKIKIITYIMHLLLDTWLCVMRPKKPGACKRVSIINAQILLCKREYINRNNKVCSNFHAFIDP